MTSTTSTFRTRFDELRSAQKRRTGVPLYTLLVNRPVGRVIAAATPRTVTPNGLTLIGAAFTYGALIALLAFADASPWSALVGVALVIGFFFDSADGQLARLRGAGSASGEWLDHVLDSGRIAFLHIATLGYLLRTAAIPTWLAFTLTSVFLLAAVVIFFGGTLFEKLTTTMPDRTVTSKSLRRSFIMLPVDTGVTCLFYVLLPFPLVFAVVYALATLAKCAVAAVLLGKWFATLRSQDADRRAAAAGEG